MKSYFAHARIISWMHYLCTVLDWFPCIPLSWYHSPFNSLNKTPGTSTGTDQILIIYFAKHIAECFSLNDCGRTHYRGCGAELSSSEVSRWKEVNEPENESLVTWKKDGRIGCLFENNQFFCMAKARMFWVSFWVCGTLCCYCTYSCCKGLSKPLVLLQHSHSQLTFLFSLPYVHHVWSLCL